MELFRTEIFLESQLAFLQSPIGVISFIVFYTFWVTLLLPGSWLSMAAGVFYGTILGTIAVLIGATFGAILTFLSGRSFLKEWVQTRLKSRPKLKYVQDLVLEDGVKFILLTRLSPLFPFGLLNLAYGLTNISLREYILGLLGIVPGTILYCNLGSIAGEIARIKFVHFDSHDKYYLILTALNLVATVAVVLFTSRAAKKALKKFDKNLN